ncbi:MAG: hypothetical protein PF690_13825 [Deltaproteobacteria bacterium]|jgi:hypothetical protein|nr:hypothetical protein [Deltaproteobacteria bacterium]
MKYLNQTKYAQHRGIRQQRVSQLIKDGYLEGALKKSGSRKLIDPVKADQLLNENLSPTKRKKRPSQSQQDFIWEDLRFLIKFRFLDPEAIKIYWVSA